MRFSELFAQADLKPRKDAIYISSKSMKFLRINPAKDIYDLCGKMVKTLLRCI
jgi:hypothetical protein